MALTDFFTKIADAIRQKDGTTEQIIASTFPQRILDIQSGGSDFESCELSIISNSESVTLPTSKKCEEIKWIAMIPVNAYPLASSANTYLVNAMFYPCGKVLNSNGTVYYALGTQNNWGNTNKYDKKENVCSDSDDGVVISILLTKGDYQFVIC